MDNKELKTLEEKAKRIVETLDNLEEETKEYQEKNMDIVSAINTLKSISKEIAKASKELSSASVLFNSSDFSKAMDEINKRVDVINEVEVDLATQTKAIETSVENVLAENKTLSDEIKSAKNSMCEVLEMRDKVSETELLLKEVASKIDRIDRNTQKGFGKERG